jgi:predicted Zn-dependent peptidase
LRHVEIDHDAAAKFVDRGRRNGFERAGLGQSAEGAFTSRLFQEVREKRGLAYSVGTSLTSHRAVAMTWGYMSKPSA